MCREGTLGTRAYLPGQVMKCGKSGRWLMNGKHENYKRAARHGATALSVGPTLALYPWLIPPFRPAFSGLHLSEDPA